MTATEHPIGETVDEILYSIRYSSDIHPRVSLSICVGPEARVAWLKNVSRQFVGRVARSFERIDQVGEYQGIAVFEVADRGPWACYVRAGYPEPPRRCARCQRHLRSKFGSRVLVYCGNCAKITRPGMYLPEELAGNVDPLDGRDSPNKEPCA